MTDAKVPRRAGAEAYVSLQAYPDRATAKRAALKKGVVNMEIAVERTAKRLADAKAEHAYFRDELKAAKARLAKLKD